MYRTIAASFWTDPKVKQLTPEGKLLLLYLITNPHTHVSGIYILPAVTIQHETGLPKRTLDTVLDTLSKLGFCSFDGVKDVIWVRRMMSYQGRGEKNLRSAACHILQDLHNSFLCKDFIEMYPQVKEFMNEPEIHTVSDRVLDRESAVRTPEYREQRTEYREQRTDQDSGAKTKKRPTSVPEFLEVTDAMKIFAESVGVDDIEGETEAMLDHFRGKGESKVDWIATWRNWMRKSQKFVSKNGHEARAVAFPRGDVGKPFGQHLCTVCKPAHEWREVGDSINWSHSWEVTCPEQVLAMKTHLGGRL